MPKPRLGNDKLLQVKIAPKDFESLSALAQKRNTTMTELVRDQIRVILAEGESSTRQNPLVLV